MKSYSFIRENAYKVVYPWNKDDDSGPAQWYAGQMHPKPGTFSQYFYFIFAPTMLYRDYYPRYVGTLCSCVIHSAVSCCVHMIIMSFHSPEIRVLFDGNMYLCISYRLIHLHACSARAFL